MERKDYSQKTGRKLCWVLLITLLVGGQRLATAQGLDCNNIGFEEGTTRGWTLTNGSVTDNGIQTIFQNETVGTFENGHLITRVSDGNDPKITTEAIPMVAPGSQYSLRIGNVTRGSRFDRIRGSFVVGADNTLFQYRFAVVLENPTHQPFQQPAFSIRITNQAGTTLACNQYDVTAAATISGFKALGDIRYRNWTTGAVDLRQYIGQTVLVDVMAHGCTEKKHFGYAYFDAQCLKTEITQALYCPGIDQTITLKAPDGFATYKWSTGETTATIKVKPTAGDRYQVMLTPYSSLNQNCQLTLDHVVTVEKPTEPFRQNVVICEGDAYQVGDSTYRRAGTYLTAIKRGTLLCDSLVQTILTLRPMARSTQSLSICQGDSVRLGTTMYRRSGTYITRLSRSGGQCDSLVTTQLTTVPLSMSVSPSVLIRPGDTTQLRALVVSEGPIRLSWTPPESLQCDTCAITTAQPTQTTQYTLLAKNTALGCQRSATVLVSVGNCIIYAPDAFTPNRDGVNDVFLIPTNACIRVIHQLTIYNRWGEVIFDCRNVQAGEAKYGWDGRFKGTDCTPGAYAYLAEVEMMDGLVNVHRGRLLLIR